MAGTFKQTHVVFNKYNMLAVLSKHGERREAAVITIPVEFGFSCYRISSTIVVHVEGIISILVRKYFSMVDGDHVKIIFKYQS